MKIKRTDLLNAFNAVSALATKRTSLPVLNCVMLGLDYAGASDLDSFAMAKFPAATEDFDPVCVPAAPFGSLLHGNAEEIELTHDNKRLTVKGDGTAKLGVLSAEEFPPFPDGGKGIGVPCGDLADCIDGVAWACADADKTGTFWHSLMRIVLAPKKISVFCGTNNVFAVMTRGVISAKAEFIVPASSAETLATALRCEGATLSLSESWVIASSPALNVAVKRAEDQYPNIDKLMTAERPAMGKLPRKQTCDVLKTVVGLGSRDPKYYPITITPGESLGISFDNGDNAYKAVVPVATQGEPFMLNAKLLLNALRKCPSDDVAVKRDDSSLVITDGDLTVLIGLVRMSTP